MKTQVEPQNSDCKRNMFLGWLHKFADNWPVYVVYLGIISCILFFIVKPVLPGLKRLIYFLQNIVFYVLIVSALLCVGKPDKGHAALLLLLGILFVPGSAPRIYLHIYMCIFAIFALACVINDLDKKRT